MDFKDTCEPSTCQYHNATDVVIGDLRVAVNRILEGQTEMRDTVIKLTEAMKGIDRLDRSIDRLQEKWEEKDKQQDVRIDELRAFMYKALGATAVIGAILGFFMKVFIGGIVDG